MCKVDQVEENDERPVAGQAVSHTAVDWLGVEAGGGDEGPKRSEEVRTLLMPLVFLAAGIAALVKGWLVAGIVLIAVLGFGSGLLNIIPLAALIGVMITVSIATFDWDALRSLRDQSPLEILTTLLTVVIVVATNNLAYGVAAGLALYYAGGFAAKALAKAS